VTWGERAAPPDTDRRAAGVVHVWDGPTAFQTVTLARQLHPEARRLVVVSGRSGSDGSYERELAAQLESFRAELQISYLTDLPDEALKSRLRALPADALVLVGQLMPRPLMSRLPGQFYRELSDLTPVPMYGVDDTQVGNGIVAAYCHDLMAAGKELARLAVEVARGVTPAGLESRLGPAAPIADDRELRRWRIPRRSLPDSAVVRFATPGVLEQYGGYALGAAGLALLQGGFIVALLIQRRRRRQVEIRHDAILRAIPDIMFLQRADGTYLKYHSRDPGALIAPPEWFLGRKMGEVLPPDLLKEVQPAFERVAARREAALVEYTIELAGSRRFFEAQIVPCGENDVLSVVRDVTERRRAELALQRSQDRYEIATAAGGVGVWDVNLETHEIYVDPALRRLLGDESGPNGSHVHDWVARVHPEDVGIVFARAQAVMAGDRTGYEGEHRLLHRDGTVRWFLVRGSLVPGDVETPPRFIGTAIDITKRKDSEHALVETREELSRVSRLTALGEFAAAIGHEVRQPLAAILMNAEAGLRFLDAGAARQSDLRIALQDIVAAGRRADEVIAHNRELFRSRTVQRTPVDLNATISEATTLVRTRLQHAHVRLEMRLSRDLPAVPADAVELQQVVLNLLANGIEAMDPVPAASRRVVIATALTPEGARVSVSDAGVGLTGVDRQRMFNTSYTTKLTGTGVGLAICRAIVDAHGGRIWAEENAGPGATFFFVIPTDATDAPGLAAPIGAREAVPRRSQ
jgi:PAS domain S-box-containing protein